MDLARLLRPASIAVVGASERPGSYGGETLLNLRAIGFPGEVWGVNPGRDVAHGAPCFPSLADLPGRRRRGGGGDPRGGRGRGRSSRPARSAAAAPWCSAPGFGEVARGVALEDALAAAARAPRAAGLRAERQRHRGHARARGALGRRPAAARAGPRGAGLAERQRGGERAATRRGLRLHTVSPAATRRCCRRRTTWSSSPREENVALDRALPRGRRRRRAACDALAVCAEAGCGVVVLKVGAVAGQAARPRRTPARSRATSACSAPWSRRPARPGPRTCTSCSSWRRCWPCRARGRRARRTRDPHLLGRRLEPGRRRGAPPRARAARVRAGHRRAPRASSCRRRHGGQPARLHGHDLGRGRRRCASSSSPSRATRRSTSCSCSTTSRRASTARRRSPGAACARASTAGAAASRVPMMVASTLPELLDDAAAWRFAGDGVPAAAGLRTGLRCAAALRRARAASPRACGPIGAGGRGARMAAAVRATAGWPSTRPRRCCARAACGGGRPARGERGRGAGARSTRSAAPVALKLSAPSSAQERAGRPGARPALGPGRAARLPAAGRARGGGAAVLVERMAPPGVELLVAARRDGVVPALDRSAWAASGPSCSTTWRSCRCPPAGPGGGGLALAARRATPHRRPRPPARRPGRRCPARRAVGETLLSRARADGAEPRAGRGVGRGGGGRDGAQLGAVELRWLAKSEPSWVHRL